MAKSYLGGELTERITIQQRALTSQNALGENVTPWADVATVWAKVEPLRGREYFAGAQMQTVVDVRFVVRYRTDITAAMRVLWRGVPHEIAQVIHNDARKTWLELMTLQGARDGR